MPKQRPSKIKAGHLARKGAVYLRQSSEDQMLNHTGSTDQRAQVQCAREWGWPEGLIVVIDTDHGRSGAAAGRRPSYEQLVRDIAAGKVGAVFVADLSRLARDAAELYRFLALCQAHDTLIVVDSKVYDPKDPAALLLTRVLAALAELNNHAVRPGGAS